MEGAGGNRVRRRAQAAPAIAAHREERRPRERLSGRRTPRPTRTRLEPPRHGPRRRGVCRAHGRGPGCGARGRSHPARLAYGNGTGPDSGQLLPHPSPAGSFSPQCPGPRAHAEHERARQRVGRSPPAGTQASCAGAGGGQRGTRSWVGGRGHLSLPDTGLAGPGLGPGAWSATQRFGVSRGTHVPARPQEGSPRGRCAQPRPGEAGPRPGATPGPLRVG